MYGITPDLTVLGKIIGGGLPVGAYGSYKEIMRLVAPSGPVSGNPLAVTAGIGTLKRLKTPGLYRKLEDGSKTLNDGIGKAALKAGLPLTQTRVGSMMCTFITKGPVRIGRPQNSQTRRPMRNSSTACW